MSEKTNPEPGESGRHTMKRLDDWLAQHNARCLWQRQVENVGWVDCFQIGRSIAHVVRYRRDDAGPFDGWDIYVAAAPNTNSIDETFALAEVSLGLRPPQGATRSLAVAKSSNQRWVEDSEKRVVQCERQLAKIVVHEYEQDSDSVPEPFRLACADLLSAKQTEVEARDALLRHG